MNAISKKLLSMLVVVAMVLSMVPFGGLSIFAVESNATEAASETVTPGQANLPAGISTTNPVDNSDEAIKAHITAGTCPMCGATGITWTKKAIGYIAAGTTHNYYELADGETEKAYSATKNVITLDGSDTICVAVLSGITLESSVRSVMMSGNGNTLNIMGTGTIRAAGTTDYGAFQLAGGTAASPNVVNLYGGSYQHVTDQTDTTNDDQAIVRFRSAYCTVNMWDGVIGPETADSTQWSENVRFNAAGTFNMYGGTIQNGVSRKNGISGNVTVAASGTFNMYGGTIKGGTYMGTTANTGGNVVVGGLAEKGSVTTAGTFKMYGGIIEGGTANDSGGNISVNHASAVMELMGGTVKDGYAASKGGNIQILNGTAHKIGGTVLITNGEAVNGGNIQIAASKKLTMEGGFIQGGTLAESSQNATSGGGVYVLGTFDMTGGEIDGCTASGRGGNIFAAGGSTVNIGADATVKNGLSKSATDNQGGGNVYLIASASAGVTMTTSGTITGGTVDGGEEMKSSGGNICMSSSNSLYQAVLTVNGGEISGGKLAYSTSTTSYGGNIRAYNSKVFINGGLIYGADAGSDNNASIGVTGGISTTANTNCTLEINGGTIVGDISAGSTAANNTVTGDYTYTCSLKITGAPKIVNEYEINGETVTAEHGGLSYYAATPYDFSGLTEGAQIVVTGSLGDVFSTTMDATVAQAIKGYFSTSNSAYAVDVNTENALYIVEAPEDVETPVVGTFNPWECGGMAYCDACLAQVDDQEDALVAWTVYDGTNIGADTALEGEHQHLYLTADATYDSGNFLHATTAVCFNLNGNDVTASSDASSAFFAGSDATINLLDSVGDAKVTGYANATSTGAAIHINGSGASATVNIYGGTYTKLAADTNSPIVLIGANGGTLNIRGGIIDARELSSPAAAPTAIMLTGTVDSSVTTDGVAEVNMYSGTIYGGTSKGNGGAIYVGTPTGTESATKTYTGASNFNMYGGTIDGGTANGSQGGGIFFIKGNTVNISGGTVKNGVATKGNGGNFCTLQVTKNDGTKVPATLNISQADDEIPTVISGGYAATNGGTFLINTGCVLNISGGTVNGGTAANAGGILRAYQADVNLSGNAVLHAGTLEGTSKTRGILLIDSDLVMSGNAAVYSAADSTDEGAAIQVGQSSVGSSLILSGNATVKSVSGASKNNIYVPYNATYPNKLMIANDWTGEAYCSIYKASSESYLRGDNITATDANHYVVQSKDDVTKGDTFTGKLYYGLQNNTPIVGVEGDLIVALAVTVAADGTETGYASNQAAVDAVTGTDAYAIMGSNDTVTLSGITYIDSHGYTMTVNGTGTLYAMDSDNDDYDGSGTWTVDDGVTVAEEAINPENGNRYISIETSQGSGKYSAHRIEVKLTAVTLRTTEAGLYYKASYMCDSTLAGRISTYGVALSTNLMPDAGFMEDYTNNIAFSALEDFDTVYDSEEHAVSEVTSCGLFGILKTGRSSKDGLTAAQLNAKYSKMEIYANAYIVVDRLADGNLDSEFVTVGDLDNGGKTTDTEGFDGVAYSLWDALDAIDGMWDELGEKQDLIVNFINTWKGEVDILDEVDDSEYAWDLTELPNINAALNSSN